jgi:hypothetical protein
MLFQIPRQYKCYTKMLPRESSEDFMKLIHELIACDEFEDIATLKVSILGDIQQGVNSTRNFYVFKT